MPLASKSKALPNSIYPGLFQAAEKMHGLSYLLSSSLWQQESRVTTFWSVATHRLVLPCFDPFQTVFY